MAAIISDYVELGDGYIATRTTTDSFTITYGLYKQFDSAKEARAYYRSSIKHPEYGIMADVSCPRMPACLEKLDYGSNPRIRAFKAWSDSADAFVQAYIIAAFPQDFRSEDDQLQ